MGVPDLDNFWTDFDYVYGRFGAEHTASFAADQDGALAGVNFATNWGSVGFFGPLCVRPDLWNSGIAQPLVAAVSDQFERWGTHHAGLCTFPHSTKHIWLYQKFGFYPRYLTAIMAVPVPANGSALLPAEARYSALSPDARREAEEASRAMADEVFEGLDLRGEIRTVAARNLGDTLMIWDSSGRLAAFGICHWGPASEAGEGCLFVKFGAVRPGSRKPLRRLARCRRCSRAISRDGERSGRRQHVARGGLHADAGARLPQPDAPDHNAPSE